MPHTSKMVDWATIELPDAWPDHWDFRNPLDIARFLRRVIRPSHERVQLPDDLPGKDSIPGYVLQEFHNLPNGNYSKKITRGYVTGFDKVMLGRMAAARQQLAVQLQGCPRAIDLGCGSGKLAAALKAAGIESVWALDPSPYLLQHAAKDIPGVNFVQGVAEATGFDDESFDAIAACFLFHEIPPRYSQQAVTEIARLLRSGGRVAICEPSSLQLELGWTQLVARFGPSAAYFYGLARFVHEPFLHAWKSWDMQKAFSEAGFNVVESNQQFPFEFLLLEKQ